MVSGEYPIGSPADAAEPNLEPQAEPPLFDNADLAEMALQHVADLNGHEIDRAARESELDEDVDMAEETSEERRQRYLHSEQGKVSDPNEWASITMGTWMSSIMKGCWLSLKQISFDYKMRWLHWQIDVRGQKLKAIGKRLQHIPEPWKKCRPYEISPDYMWWAIIAWGTEMFATVQVFKFDSERFGNIFLNIFFNSLGLLNQSWI